MRVLRWTGIALGVLVVLMVAVAGIARISDGPIGPFTGGPLEAGELVDGEAIDWTFASDIREIEFQLLSPPRSRTVWALVHEGELYIPCGAPTTAFKQWPQEALVDGRSLLRIEGRRYEREAVRVTDPGLLAALSGIVAEKYGLSSETEPEPDDVWFFRMDPPRG